jgi:hypothetical protein
MAIVKLSDEKGWLPRVYVNGHETHLASWMASVEERLEQLTAGQPTTESPTKDNLSDAAATGSITASMQRSSPLAPLVTESGPAEQGFWCAHPWLTPLGRGVEYTCPRCHARLSHDKILVPAAAPTPSTSQKQDSSPSAVSSSEASAPSASGESTDPWNDVPMKWHTSRLHRAIRLVTQGKFEVSMSTTWDVADEVFRRMTLDEDA